LLQASGVRSARRLRAGPWPQDFAPGVGYCSDRGAAPKPAPSAGQTLAAAEGVRYRRWPTRVRWPD